VRVKRELMNYLERIDGANGESERGAEGADQRRGGSAAHSFDKSKVTSVAKKAITEQIRQLKDQLIKT
jgi:hypothetical protein